MKNEPAVNGTKKCAGPCQKTLPVLYFAAAGGNKDGLRDQCRACYNEKEHARNKPKKPLKNQVFVDHSYGIV